MKPDVFITRFSQCLVLLLSLFMLSGCGGASGSNEVTDTPTIGAKLTVRLTDEQNQIISTVEATSAVLISVVATNDFGRATSGVSVTFTTDLGSVSQDTALTNSSGVATIRLLTTSTQLGVAAVTATATVDSKAVTATSQIEITELVSNTNSLNVSLLDASCTNAVTSVVAGSRVCLMASLFQGTTPLGNEVIDLVTSKGTLSTSAILTDETGVATAYIDSTVDLLGAATVTATSGTATKSINYEYAAFIPEPTQDPVVSLTLFDANCSTPVTTLEAGFSFCLKARLLQDNIPLSNEIITFAAPIGNLRQATVLTDETGFAVTYIDSTVSISGASAVSASFGSFTDIQNYQYIPPPAGTGATISLAMYDESCNTLTNNIAAGSSFCLKAIVIDQNQLKPNVIVEFLAPIGTLRQTTALTNEQGEARVILDSSGTEFGAAIASATFENATDLANYQFSDLPNTGGIKLNLTVRNADENDNCTNLTNSTAAASPLCLTVKLTDDGAPLAGKVIAFSTSLGTLEQTTALTDETGNTFVILNSASTDVGAATATATYNEFVASANYEFTKGDSEDITTVEIKTYDADCLIETNATIAGTPLCVEAVIKTGGKVLENEIVAFSITLGELVPANALTNAQGVARTSIHSLPIVFGAATVTATYLGVTRSKNYELIEAVSTRDMVMTVFDEDCLVETAVFLSGNSVCLSIKLTDEAGPLSNEVVNFATELGALRQQSALTDAQGIAHVFVDSTPDVLGATAATASIGALTTTGVYEFVSDTGSQNTGPELELVTKLNNDFKNSFKVGESVSLNATLTAPDTVDISNKIVRFSIERGLLSSDSALTDINGLAKVTLSADAIHVGAAVATAQVFIDNVPYTQTFNYQVLAADSLDLDLKVGHFDDNNNFIEGQIGIKLATGDETLSAGGTLGLKVAVVNQNLERYTTPIAVTFTSSCASNNTANLDAEVLTINGEAQSTYEDISCATATGNQDTVVATITLNNVASQATRLVNLAPELLGSVEFISAEPTSIVLKGSGGQGKKETSTLTFSVKGALDNPLSQQPVTFSLDSGVGDLSINPQQSLTNSQGLVTTKVTAGNIPTAVRVSASTIGKDAQGNELEIRTQSDLLSVNTGLPDQNSITLSTDNRNPEVGDFDGIAQAFKVYMADSFNNPVPDGTTINFTTEGGFIQSSCNTVNGSCEVLWTSGESRVANHRITIMAAAIGHETFFDVNGNNVYDDADGNVIHAQGTDSGLDRGEYASSGFVDQSEAWRDDNENRVHDSGEFFIDFNNDKAFTSADSLFNGPQCTHASLCSGSKINVRKALVMIMSGSSVVYTLMADDLAASTNTGIEHVGTKHVVSSNDNISGLSIDGGIEVASVGTITRTVGDGIILQEDASVQLTLALSDDASPLGQILPSGTRVVITTSFGSIVTQELSFIANSIGTSNPNGYGGTLYPITLTNTNQVSTTGDGTVEGLLTISFLLPTSNQTFTITQPFTAIGDGG